MQFDDDSVDVSGVEDRRGARGGRGVGRGAVIGGGGGIVGLLVVAVVLLLGGGGLPNGAIDLDQVAGGGVSEGAGTASLDELREKCAEEGALDRYTDCRLVKVYNLVNSTWGAELARRGLSYEQPGLVFFSGGVQTGCGPATSSVGPFYCPPDRKMYFDLDFLEQLQADYGAPGEFAQAYILAHEAGHHLQTLLGIEREMRRLQQQDPRQANALSVRLELQADCFAGVWARLADQNEGAGLVLTRADVEEALNAAAAVGDDRIQESAGQRVDPERWTHGSAQQRQQWFYTGYDTGDLSRCDTFSA